MTYGVQMNCLVTADEAVMKRNGVEQNTGQAWSCDVGEVHCR